MDSLFEQITSVQLVDDTGARRFVGDRPDLTDYAVVLDGCAAELRYGNQVLPLHRRTVARELLYALAAAGGRAVSKEELVRAGWQVEYDPLRHDNTLRVSVRRLRTLLEGTELEILTDGPDYRLQVPAGFAYLCASTR